jgi:hypothetical protein
MFRLITVALFAACSVQPAGDGYDFRTYEETLGQVGSDAGCHRQDYPAFPFFICDEGRTYFYFTNPGEPVHPGYIRRTIFVRDGATYVTTTGHSDGTDEQQPAFQAWMTHVGELIASNNRD